MSIARTIAVALLSLSMGAGASTANAPSGGHAAPAPRLEASRVAQGASQLPPNQRCPTTQPPSTREIRNPYVIWKCVRDGAAQFDYYVGLSYQFSVRV
jgi:hypothetical protein